MVQFMDKGNTVKVTFKESDDFNRIGIIMKFHSRDNAFIEIDFGTHTSLIGISNLLDLTYKAFHDAH